MNIGNHLIKITFTDTSDKPIALDTDNHEEGELGNPHHFNTKPTDDPTTDNQPTDDKTEEKENNDIYNTNDKPEKREPDNISPNDKQPEGKQTAATPINDNGHSSFTAAKNSGSIRRWIIIGSSSLASMACFTLLCFLKRRRKKNCQT